MVELKFTILRVLVDIVFVGVLFFGVLCGIHYGTHLLGMYFWFVKVMLGAVGMAAFIFISNALRPTITFFLKNASIYAQCTHSNSILAGIKGMNQNFVGTISIAAFNKLIRSSTGVIKDFVLGDKEVPEILQEFSETKVMKVSKFIAIKAYDYVDECVLGYCYTHTSDDKKMPECAVEGFTLFVVHSGALFGKVLATISIQVMCKIFYWIVIVAIFFKTVKFSLLNVIMCYVIAKCLEFIIDDAIFEPVLMYSILSQFNKYEWNQEYSQKVDALAGCIPGINKLRSYYKGDEEIDEQRESDSGDSSGVEEERME